jgi:G3E family GTPase
MQGVHQMFEGLPDREWKDGEERVNKMVFIGKDLPQQLMKECFEECLWTEAGAVVEAA